MLMVTIMMEMIMIIMIMIADDYCDNDHNCHHRYIELTEDDKEKLKGSYKV